MGAGLNQNLHHTIGGKLNQRRVPEKGHTAGK